MPNVQDIINLMETWAPLPLAESWDNPGLMVGRRDQEVTGILTTLDVTLEAIDYAVQEGANLIISHHPFIFKGIKQLDLASPQGRMIEKAIKHDIAIYSAHTNLDIAQGGLNDMLAARLGLVDVTGFVKTSTAKNYKLVTYAPVENADDIRQALGDAGAGFIGNYSHCSFSAHGEGRFQPEEGANPYLGQEGTLEMVREVRIETIVPEALLSSVVKAMKEAHPYEEVAYDVFELVEPVAAHTLGRMGRLPKAMTLAELTKHVEAALPKARLRLAGAKPEGAVERMALCSGGGADFIGQAKAKGAQVYLTGDVKYHDAQRAKELGLLVIDAGHFGTEEIVAEGLKDKLSAMLAEESWSIPVIANDKQNDFFF